MMPLNQALAECLDNYIKAHKPPASRYNSSLIGLGVGALAGLVFMRRLLIPAVAGGIGGYLYADKRNAEYEAQRSAACSVSSIVG